MKIDLRGTRIWLTGASRGLGKALALELTAAGARIALSARDGAALEEVAAACRGRGGDVITVEVDVTDASACQRAADEIVAKLGGIDLLVANAGISMWTPFAEIEDPAVFEKLMQVNYLGVVYCVRASLPHLRASAALPGGMIVNISSLQAWTGMPAHTGYGASKAAVQIFLDSLKMETPGLRVLGVYPGWISGTSLRASALGADGASLGASRKSHNRLSVSAEGCAQRIVGAMHKGKSMLFIPWYLRLLYLLRPVAFPLVAWILTKATHTQKTTA
jgi:NAD(P)-dependent dehydrogenase (short-subunit alcohol dehydrogenase family)